VAGIAAFLTVFLTGSLFATLLDRAGADTDGGSTPTDSPSASNGTEPSPRIRAYLVWVPGGLPPTLEARSRRLGGFDQVTAVAEDTAWMVASYQDDGTVVDKPDAPYMTPIDAAAIDPAGYAAMLPPDARATVSQLRPGEGLLGETSAAIRDLGPGGRMEFQGGFQVTIVGVLPDELVGAAELVVDRDTGDAIGIAEDRYLLLRASPDKHPTASGLRDRILRLLPSQLPYRTAQVRAPGQARYLRMGDAVLPPSLIKLRFGEWRGYPDPASPGSIVIDPTWVDKKIVTTTVPVLGEVTCHRKLIPQLRAAMRELTDAGLASTIHAFNGCFAARNVLSSPSAAISHHAWGIAVDVNADTNPFGRPPAQDRQLVELMERWGFTWGGSWIVPDGMHFEFLRPPPKT
jgi:D-alanyl-D-alanine carboxypeptidase